MSLLLCLGCGEPVVEVEGEWVALSGKPCKGGRAHSVRQIVPDPENGARAHGL